MDAKEEGVESLFDQEVSSLIPCGCVFCSVSLGNPPVGNMFGTGSTLFGYSATRLRSL